MSFINLKIISWLIGFIYYDKDMYIKRGFHICIDEYSLDDGDYPVAMTDDLHRPCFYDHPEIFLTIMLHELGHYRNGDLQIENTNQEKIQEERLNAIISGRVQEQERKADAFAAQHVGKNTFMRTMDYMIRKRKERGDEGMGLAIREFELRKKAIQNMKI